MRIELCQENYILSCGVALFTLVSKVPMTHDNDTNKLAARVRAIDELLKQLQQRKLGFWGRVRRRLRFERCKQRIKQTVRDLHSTGVVAQLDDYHGRFELPLSNNMTKRLLQGGYESTQQRLFEAILKPGDQVIDVGANLGLFTVLSGALVGETGRVLAIEPVPSMLTCLHGNIRRNRLTNVTVFEGVATDTVTQCEIHTAEGAEEYSSIKKIAHPHGMRDNETKVVVEGVPIDSLVVKHSFTPQILKVDTEGAEGLVFSGAAETLRRYQPIIFSELDDRLLSGFGWKSGRVVELLSDLGYYVFDQNTRSPLTRSTEGFVGDVLAIPEKFRSVLTA